jgi:hypothetical protein
MCQTYVADACVWLALGLPSMLREVTYGLGIADKSSNDDARGM